MIRNIIFDIGNVLVDFRWREMMANLGMGKELQDEFEKSMFGSKWWNAYDHGIMEEEEILAHLRADNQVNAEAFEEVWAHRDELVKPYQYAVPWIRDLKAKGYKTYLLSNYPANLFTMHAENGSFPFVDEVDGKIVSGFVKLIKPDADIYEKLMEVYGLEAKECVFIDDKEENVQAAMRLGMQGIVFQSFEQAERALREMMA